MKIIEFTEYLDMINESKKNAIKAEVNSTFASQDDKKKFESIAKASGFNVSWGRNRYADTLTIEGERQKIVNFLKRYGYAEQEIKFIKE